MPTVTPSSRQSNAPAVPTTCVAQSPGAIWPVSTNPSPTSRARCDTTSTFHHTTVLPRATWKDVGSAPATATTI